MNPGVLQRRFEFTNVLSVVALGLMLSSSVLFAEEPDDDPEFLIKQLQHEDFDRRRVAAEKLAALGELAREALDKAASTDDVELKEALATLMSKLDKATVKILAFDRDGKPATGAEADVRVYNVQGIGRQWTETLNEPITINADGTSTLKSQAPGQVNLQMTWRKWSQLYSGSGYHTLQLQRGINPITMTLSGGATVSCDIVDDAGKPVKDAQIVLYSRGVLEELLLEQQLAALENWDRSATVSGFADEKGKATIETVNDGVYQVVIKSTTHYPLLGPMIRVREREKLELPAFKLTPRNPGKLEVVFQKADGEPIKKTRMSLDMEYQFEGPNKEELQRNAKKLVSQINMNRQGETSETDESGKITLENLKPGKYKLTAMAVQNIWHAAEFNIPPNQTLELGVLKPSPVGSIKGKITTDDGKGMQHSNVYVVAEKDVVDANEGDLLTDWRFVYRQFGVNNSAQSQADGTYELKTLLPGKYILTVSARTGQTAVIYGLEVTAGKETLAKDLVIPGKAQTTSQIIKGTVLLPDGKPAGGASVSLFGPGRWGANTDDKGNFNYNVSPEQGWVPTRLTIKAPKCKPAVVDLTVSGVKLDAISVKLEKQDFGDLRVKVIDENQKPLGNVLVTPVTRGRNHNGMPIVPRRTLTNKRGEVRLSGLAAGERSIQLQCDGYFCDDTIKVPVLADRENEITVTMKSGRKISGTVQLPEGVPFSSTVAYLFDNRTRVCAVDAKGRFEFSGLGAGTYYLTATAPGYMTVERMKLVITANSTEPEGNPVLKLERPYVAVAGVDPAFKGWSMSLSAEGSWDPERKVVNKNVFYGNSAYVDATGRAEFWGVTPGSYDVVLNPPQPMNNRYRWYETTMKRATASLLAGPISPLSMQKSTDMKTLQPSMANVKSASGSVTGRVICENVQGSTGNTGSVSLRVVGSAAVANLHFTYPSDFTKQKNREPIIIGTPPTADKKPAPPGSFSITGLPPGDYRIYIELNPYRYNVSGTAAKEPPVKPTPVAAARFTLKQDEKLELPVIKFQPPEDLVKTASTYEEWQYDVESDDMIPVFQP